MSSTGAGYDQTTIVFSPDGRMYQTEYAAKAVENAGTSIGVRCRDGVILATEKMMPSKMLVRSSNRRIFTVDSAAGMACSGFAPDGRQLVNQARGICVNYRKQVRLAGDGGEQGWGVLCVCVWLLLPWFPICCCC